MSGVFGSTSKLGNGNITSPAYSFANSINTGMFTATGTGIAFSYQGNMVANICNQQATFYRPFANETQPLLILESPTTILPKNQYANISLTGSSILLNRGNFVVSGNSLSVPLAGWYVAIATVRFEKNGTGKAHLMHWRQNGNVFAEVYNVGVDSPILVDNPLTSTIIGYSTPSDLNSVECIHDANTNLNANVRIQIAKLW